MLYAVQIRPKKQTTPMRFPSSHTDIHHRSGSDYFLSFRLIIVAIPTLENLMTKSLPEDIRRRDDSRCHRIPRWWAFDYPEEGVTTANELAFPVGKQKLNVAPT